MSDGKLKPPEPSLAQEFGLGEEVKELNEEAKELQAIILKRVRGVFSNFIRYPDKLDEYEKAGLDTTTASDLKTSNVGNPILMDALRASDPHMKKTISGGQNESDLRIIRLGARLARKKMPKVK